MPLKLDFIRKYTYDLCIYMCAYDDVRFKTGLIQKIIFREIAKKT